LIASPGHLYQIAIKSASAKIDKTMYQIEKSDLKEVAEEAMQTY